MLAKQRVKLRVRRLARTAKLLVKWLVRTARVHLVKVAKLHVNQRVKTVKAYRARLAKQPVNHTARTARRRVRYLHRLYQSLTGISYQSQRVATPRIQRFEVYGVALLVGVRCYVPLAMGSCGN